MENPKISIISPCYNSEGFVHHLLDSIINQTYKNLEFIIVNDGSTDKTLDVLNSYKPKFKQAGIDYKIISTENGGQASAVNTALKQITGEYLIWPDSDDYFPSNAIEILYNFLKVNPEFQMVRGGVNFCNEETLETIKIKTASNPDNHNLFDMLLKGKDIYCFAGNYLIKTDVFFKNNNGKDIFISREGQNIQILLPASYNGKCGNINDIVYNCMVRVNSHSNRRRTLKKDLNRQNEIINIYTNTINKLPASAKEKKKYINLIKRRYNKVKFITFNKHILKKVLFYDKWKKTT